ncbi:serine/arginine repetitive matrix protein 3-like [Corvus moneduloides]|uniref:serine/arginine repetitive matrix protein 3-like n=1 Tax=Corvus moneduloides TaxID=1196302 RepID=UPI001363386B|nr:serine/arginine repetitive matrix protein 3-like [Corvus moneduloides]
MSLRPLMTICWVPRQDGSSGANPVCCISTPSSVPATAHRWSATHVLHLVLLSVLSNGMYIEAYQSAFAGSASYPSAVLSARLSSASLRLLASCFQGPRSKRCLPHLHVINSTAAPGAASLSAPAATARARASTSEATRVTPRHCRPVPCQARPRRRDPRGAARRGRAGQRSPLRGAGAGVRGPGPRPPRRSWHRRRAQRGRGTASPAAACPAHRGQNVNGTHSGSASPDSPGRAGGAGVISPPASISAEPRRGRCPAPAAPRGSGELQPRSDTRVSPGVQSARTRRECLL